MPRPAHPNTRTGPNSVQDVEPKRITPHPSGAPAPAPTSAPTPARRPDLGFLLAHPAHLIALGGGSGLSPIAPGTAGTLWGWAVYVLLLQPWLTTGQIGWLIAAAIPIGWWACTVTARHLRMDDPGAIVWDEVVAIWLVLWLLMPTGWWGQCLAFALFRFFDAAKPQPVRWADRHFKGSGWRGGWGIMFDDLVAAFCTLLVLALGRHLSGG